MNQQGQTEAGAGLPVRILVLDDDATTTAVLGRVLASQGWEVLVAHDMRTAAATLSSTVPAVAIVDVYLQDEDGLEFVRRLRSRSPDIGIVVISSEDTSTLAAKAVESGADDFLSKPISPAALSLRVRKLVELRTERERSSRLERELHRSVRDTLFPEIVTQCDNMRAALRLVEKVGPRELTVLIFGESGTGKELVARAIHQLSPRAKGPFVELNSAALPPNLVESELFGHERGAFTGAIASRAGKIEQATGGTLFLDEIGELPLETQPKLLRALQEKRITRVGGKGHVECDFRLVSATNSDLANLVRDGRFREDLYYRVAVFPIKLPPLRDRPEDLDLLLMHFLRHEGLAQPRITPEAREVLHSYNWPGNVRELKNFAQASALLADGGLIDGEHVRHYFGSRLGSLAASLTGGRSRSRERHDPMRPVRRIDEIEREEIMHALKVFAGSVPESARALGMGRATLYKYLDRHDIDPKAAAREK